MQVFQQTRWRGAGPWVAVFGGFFVLYAAVFALTSDARWLDHTGSALANALPLSLLSFGVFRLTPYAPAQHPLMQVWHAFFASGFVVLWMSAVVVLDTSFDWIVTGNWSIWWWSGPGLTWQSLQGFFIYATVAIWSSYLNLRAVHIEAAAPSERVSTGTHGPARLLLVQQDEGLVPVDPSHILAIEATGDYVKLHRAKDSLLVNMTLGDAHDRFGVVGYLRVHRSWLVRLDAVSLFEPLGQGRWRALMSNQLEVPVSKSGAKVLRELVL